MGTYNPVSTYRLQFNSGFTLKDANRVLGYLRKLGIRTIYASPIFQAVSGSKHGYDVTDPLSISSEIGSEPSFIDLIQKIQRRGMGWLQDIVPNHMAYSTENKWIYDLLLKGKESAYYKVFDIFQAHPDRELQERLMLPFFGKTTERLILDGDLVLQFSTHGFCLKYFDDEYPVSREAYQVILENVGAGNELTKIRDIADGNLPAIEWEALLEELIREYGRDPAIAAHIDHCIKGINEDRTRMGILLGCLNYSPVHWKETEQRINYRRFFTINRLICVNIHQDQVFELYHKLINKLTDTGLLDGLRIDHIDGLYDPSAYLERMRRVCGEDTYLTVEKILERNENLAASWPVQGTTGYDFLALVNNLLTNSANARFFYDYHRKWAGISDHPELVFREKKRYILYHRLNGELDFLTYECLSLGLKSLKEIDPVCIRKAIGEFMVHCPVYRYYHAPSGFTDSERKSVRKIIRLSVEYDPANKEALTLLERMFLLTDTGNKDQIGKIDHFFRRLMQFTGPLMAKGLEDTAYYSFNPFIAHNEVGDSPGYFGINKEAFHRQMSYRLAHFPLTMNTLSTHDTKRGEDARARLNVLSDVPGHWKSASRTWRKVNKEFKASLGQEKIPLPADEYLIYQALCAHIPMNGEVDNSFRNRFREYLIKALREAKERTSWSDPDSDYERHVIDFANKILAPEHKFLENLCLFVGMIIPHGIINSITQAILKNTVPGVPDTFQGSETWNLSFVDPDNRRPVDFPRLAKDLDQMVRAGRKHRGSLLAKLWNQPLDGKVKQWISYLTLQERVKRPELFLKGSYIPLRISGKYKSNVMAFYRSYRDDHLVVVVPLHTACMPEGHTWEDTVIRLPDLAPVKWENIFTGENLSAGGELHASEIFREFPFAVMAGIPFEPSKRAGILMHVSSLPGGYGSGDLGQGAYDFIDFLHGAGQRYWQILPLSITSLETSHSPYSSRSAFAGNALFIDPGQLVTEGLLEDQQLSKYKSPVQDKADYRRAEMAKSHFLDKAYHVFKSSCSLNLRARYDNFMEQEAYWLQDYALFEVLRSQFPDGTWVDWPPAYRDRHKTILEEFRKQHRDACGRIYFEQFIFSEQWSRVKMYANDRGVDIFGDIPIYIDYHSADVWAHPELFRLNPDKSMEAVSGVPPDYFNQDGQLWGMPLYNWEGMETDQFRWWLKRIEKNLQWYDLLRLDHFRGFSAYWEVSAHAVTAREGKWKNGPGVKLFEAIRKRFPGMPIVAEDLGQIDQDVYDLRDRFKLPGMRVILFGFGPEMSFSHHNPGNITYNSIAYTGTHDTNTIKGWYRLETDQATLERFRAYTGRQLKEKNVHREMIRLVYASVARLVIIPMQDWLGLDEISRMNFPSTTAGNWLWRMDSDILTGKLEKKIRKKVRLFGRY